MLSTLEGFLREASRFLSRPVDQISFVFCLILCLPLGVIYRTLFHPRQAPPVLRHWVGLIWGLLLAWIQLQSQLYQLLLISALCYGVTRYCPGHHVHKAVFVISMAVLSVSHVWRLLDAAGEKIDVSGPIMIMVQKMTYVAFSLHDGTGRKQEELRDGQKKERILKVPTPLEYFSYMFHYSSLLAGPSCTFKEYMDFITGKDLIERGAEQKVHEEPSPTRAVLQKIRTGGLYLAAFYFMSPLFPVESNGDPTFTANNSFWWRLLFAYVSSAVVRFKYYFVFITADAVNNACGLGFNGYDATGKPLWNRMNNVNVLSVEFASGFKMITDNWHMMTASWLRRTVYERVRYQRTLATYAVSAIWHGFFPGYYLTAVASALGTLAGRKIRRSLTDVNSNQSSFSARGSYLLGKLVTIIMLTYCTIPFWMLHYEKGVEFFRSMYFYGHIGCVLVLLFVTGDEHKPRKDKKTENGHYSKATPLPSKLSRSL